MNVIYNGPNNEHLFSLQCEDSAIGIDNPEVLQYYTSRTSGAMYISGIGKELQPNDNFPLPDSIKVEYKHINPCIQNGDCLFTGDDYRVHCKLTCQKIYPIAHLKLKSLPENEDKKLGFTEVESHRILRKHLEELKGLENYPLFSVRIRIINAMEEYSQQQLSEVNKENERLRKALHSIRGALYSRDTLDYVLKDIDEILTENGFEWQPED